MSLTAFISSARTAVALAPANVETPNPASRFSTDSRWPFGAPGMIPNRDPANK
jgi:hypothetical protein